MADYTSLAIGINRYQYIQPLSYAQNDAQAIHQLLVEETELPPNQALMLTDVSPWVENQSTEPTREVIDYWLDQWLPKQATSLLWFFFSGYGVSWQGEDYLMPMDGNPTNIPQTAIRIQDLVTKIQAAGFKDILMLLDINRSPGVIADQSVGGHIAQLAPEQGISLVLSSQVEETSHEAVALGHGIFTAALLEGLRYYGPQTNLDCLGQYLYERLPELSEHHWRPMQHPLIIIPSVDSAQASLLPGGGVVEAIEADVVTTDVVTVEPVLPSAPPDAVSPTDLDAFPTELLPEPLPDPDEALAAAENALANDGTGLTPTLPPFGATPPPRSSTEALHSDSEAEVVPQNPPEGTEPPTAPIVPEPLSSNINPPPKKQSSWLWWGALLLIVLGALGFLFLFLNRRPAPVAVDVPLTEPTESIPGSVPTTPGNNNAPAVLEPPTAESPQQPPSQPPSPPTSPPTPPNTAATNLPQEPAPSPTPANPAIAAPRTVEESQAILAKARTYIQANQASGFSQAIAEASKIPPGAPLYAEAQADIVRWGQVILDIARGRANQGEFGNAIAAAQLITPAQTTVHPDAQQQIAQWQGQFEQQKQNSETIRTARRQIRYTQASSYSQAIITLRAIPENQPGYRQAQDLIDRWSNQIHLIANSRAARGDYNQAIETAKLVPPNTASYDAAQKAIARWQEGRP